MKFFFDIGNKFAEKSDWTDFALTKFCLFAMGIICGSFIADKDKKPARAVASLVFIGTYIPLMAKLLKIVLREEENEYVTNQPDNVINYPV